MKKKTQFAFIRQLQKGSGANLKTLSDIKSAERHANRLDNTSALRQRKGASHADNYFWSNIGEGLEAGGADYVAAYKAHKLRHGVKSERKGAALASHALVGVSPEWLEETGSPHDLNNPRVQALIEASKAWVETWSGEGMVWGVRYDVDEVGSGVVDVLASPVHVQFHKSGSSSPKISINKANDKLLSQVNERLKKEWVTGGQKSEDYKPVRKSFRAMQYSWAWYAQEHLSPELQRGIYIETTRRQHLFPEEYKEALAAQEKYDALKKVAQKDVEELTRGQRRLERREQELEAERRQWDNTLQQRKAVSAELEQKMAELGSVQRLLDKAKDELSNAREQGDMILSNAKRQADEITKAATDHVVAFVESAATSWAEFKDLPKPFVEMKSLYDALLNVVSELFSKFNLKDDAEYKEQVSPDELGQNGELPSVRDLLEQRAKARSEQIGKAIKTIDNNGPQI